jgi:acyl-CoA thioester hydrolase
MSGRLRTHEVRVQLEVPFYDVDILRVVWHGHYYKYFELARTELLRSIGLDAGDLIGVRYGFLVSESQCRHVQPLEYGERFEVAAWIRDYESRICIDYEITSLDRERRSAKGRTVLVSTDLEGRLLLRTPQAIRDRIAG